MGNKVLYILGIIIVLITGIGLIGVAIQAGGESIPEIDQNQLEDEISRTITVHLQDGITSSDDIR